MLCCNAFSLLDKAALLETHHVLEIRKHASGEITNLPLRANLKERSLNEIFASLTAIASASAGSLRHSRNASLAWAHRCDAA